MPHDHDAESWMEQAGRDLAAAEHLLRGSYSAHATVLAHLAVEKALKGVFREQKGAAPPVTHDLRYLARRVDLPWSRDRREALDGLSDVSIVSLYAPDHPFGHPVSENDAAARERVANARMLVDWLGQQREYPSGSSHG